MITRRNLTLMLAALPFGATKAGAAQAQSYPAKPIRFVVPFPAGGSTDVGARLIAENLSRTVGQQVYVENKSGANGAIGIEDAAKSAPDGYTILVTIDTVASNPHVFHTNIDPSKDLLPIIQVSRQPIVLAAHPALGVNSVAELIALAKKQPGLPYATGSGLGSTPLISHYKAGTLRLLAQTTKARSPSLPDVPTYEEAGIKGLVLDQWLGVFAPVGTPPEIVEFLNSEIGKAVADPAVRKSFLDSAQEPIGGTADQFTQLVREDYAKFGRLVKDLNIKVE